MPQQAASGWTPVQENTPPPSGWTPVEEPPKPPSAPYRFASNFSGNIGAPPRPTLWQDAATNLQHPIDALGRTLRSFSDSQVQPLSAAQSSWQAGNYTDAVRHFFNYMIPFLGPQMDKEGDQLQSGDYVGATGGMAGTAANVLFGKAMADPEAAASTGSKAMQSAWAGAKGAYRAADVAGLEIPSKLIKVARNTASEVAAPWRAKSPISSTSLPDIPGPDVDAGALAGLPGTGAQPAAQTGEALAEVPGAPYRMRPQAAALGDLSTTASQPAAKTGEALAQIPQYRYTIPAAKAPLLPADESPSPLTARQAVSKIGPMIEEGLGNPPAAKPSIAPGQPIYRRVGTSAPEADTPAIGEGMPASSVPVSSKALKSFHYDEPTQTLTVELNQGSMHRYGEVTPEEAQQFADSESKGRAWLDLKDNHVHLGANYGKGWVNKVAPTTSDPNDLTPQLQDSLDDVNVGKAAGSRPKWRFKTR